MGNPTEGITGGGQTALHQHRSNRRQALPSGGLPTQGQAPRMQPGNGPAVSNNTVPQAQPITAQEIANTRQRFPHLQHVPDADVAQVIETQKRFSELQKAQPAPTPRQLQMQQHVRYLGDAALIVPTCDRCRTLRLECKKDALTTACVSCRTAKERFVTGTTKERRARCSWEDAQEDEMKDIIVPKLSREYLENIGEGALWRG